MTENIDNATVPELLGEVKDTESKEPLQWFALRDLTRANAKRSGYNLLEEAGYEVFTPMKWVIKLLRNKRTKEKRPVIHDLVFVHSCRKELDPFVFRTQTLQYRYIKGAAYCTPMTVRDRDMERFIRAITLDDMPRYFSPSEITPSMIGKRVRINGGVFNGFEGNLLSIRGTRKKRLIVSIPDLIVAAPEISPEFIELID